GLEWVINEGELAAGFSFLRHPDRQKRDHASSGGVLTFYNHPCNRTVHEYLSFSCKASESGGEPDFGVRIALDDAKIGEADREYFAYETRSVVSLGNPRPTPRWQRYYIDLWQLERAETRRRFPGDSKMDQNVFNKIVFFVDNQ